MAPAEGRSQPPATSPGSLVALLQSQLADAFDRTAIVDGLTAAATDRAGGPWSWTWGELAAAAVELAAALSAAGCRPGDRVAHAGPHAPDWVLVDLACLLAGVVHVPLHADSSHAELREQLGWLEPRGIVVSGTIAGLAPRDLAGLVVVDAVRFGLGTAGWRRLATDAGEVRDRVAGLAARIDPDACSTILLSSGTTGLPHGVMHSQRTLAANAVAAAAVFLDDPRDVRLSWLPLSHSLALTGDLGTALVRGGCLNMVRDRGRMLDACRALPPTVILGVPAFFERLERAATGGRITNLAEALGGETRVCISGGGPLRRRTAEFFAARRLPLVDGYGLAEAGPVVTLANPRTARVGTVGPPLPGVEIRIDDRPATRGQLLVRTPSRALGVVVPPGSEAPPRSVDGWLETGDRAEIDADGHVRITGRLGDTLVLSTGVKVPAAAVEATLAEDDAVAQVCVVGTGLRWPAAVVVPEPGVLRGAIRRMGLVVMSRRQAVRHPRVVAWLSRRLARRQAGLPRAWRARTVVISERPFAAARGEATASLKPRRTTIEANFRRRVRRAEQVVEGLHDGSRGNAMKERIDDGRGSWLAAAVWNGAGGGFAAAAARSAAPVPGRIEAVLERAEAEITRLRADGAIYDPLPGAHGSAPLADAPPPPFGVFSAEAERRLGGTGLWGLAVPEAHGGAAASMSDLARGITRLAVNVPTAAGMLAVHSSIGAVSALVGFGSDDQRARHLPGLAAGSPLSIFGATEPDAGCDLGRATTRLDDVAGRLLLTGTKMFITGAAHGRLVKVLAVRGGRPVVVLARLPAADTDSFRLLRYPLHPLRHSHNAALEFTSFEVDPRDVLDPGADGDAMRIVWHGLNRGRVTLTAQAAGTLRLLRDHARAHAVRRVTWGRAIASRQLVRARLGRIAASAVACDALAAWAAAAIDDGQSGEWEAITAKVLASHCLRDAAIDALGVHGGRAFLVGHPLGDSLHDHFAVSVYEGESELLGLALFKGLAKRHPLAEHGHASAWRRAGSWLAWRTAAMARRGGDAEILDASLRGHARAARRELARLAVAIDRAIRRHGRALADRQVEVAGLSAAVREAVSVLAVTHHADAAGNDALLAPADAWCRLALARAAGRMPGPDALASAAAAADG